MVVHVAKCDWFADLHSESHRAKLVLVGGLAERGEGHPAGVDMFVNVTELNRSVLVLAPLRAIDPKVATSGPRGRHYIKRVDLKHVVLQAK